MFLGRNTHVQHEGREGESGRVLTQAPRDEAAALVAAPDLHARCNWLELFPFLATRRPDAYMSLTDLA